MNDISDTHLVNQSWPLSFHFERDPVCQKYFKPYIDLQLIKLAELDALRPPHITYIFHQHAQRVAHEVSKASQFIGLGDTISSNLFYASLLHDMGKTLLPVSIWDSMEKPNHELKMLRRSHTTLGKAAFLDHFSDISHPFKDLAGDIIYLHHEQMDGQGPHKVDPSELSLPVRLVSIIEAFDGWSIPRPHFGSRDISIPAVLERMRIEKAGMFDQALFESFAQMKLAEYKKASHSSC